jgi:hypothetical protein
LTGTGDSDGDGEDEDIICALQEGLSLGFGGRKNWDCRSFDTGILSRSMESVSRAGGYAPSAPFAHSALDRWSDFNL